MLPSVFRTSTITPFLAAGAITATGYLRELVLASLYGVGSATDAFYFAVALVSALHELIFAGVLAATIVPLLHSDDSTSTAAASRRARLVVTATVVVVFVGAFLAVTLCILMPYLIPAAAPGMSEPVRALSINFSMIFIWSLPASALTVLFTLVLNAHDRFALAGLVYVGNNLLFVILLMAFGSRLGARALPIAALTGSVLMAVTLAVYLVRLRLLRMISPDLSREFFAAVWRLSRPLLLSVGLGSAGGLLMASQLIIRASAGNHGEGAIAALGYAFRLYQVPLSLVANPAASLVLPLVASFYMTRRLEDVAALCRQALLWGLVLLFPAAAMLWGGSEFIVEVLLRRGSFDAEAVRLTAEALRGFVPAVVLEASVVVFFRVFYALRMPGWTVTVAFVTLVSLIALLLLFPQVPFGLVPLFFSASYGIAAVLLIILLISILGWSVLPPPEQLVRWLAGAAIAIAAARTAAWMASGRTAQAIELTCFACVYVLAIGLLLPECRRVAVAMGRQTVARTAWWRT